MRLSLVGSTVPVKSFFELRQARRIVSVIVVIIESIKPVFLDKDLY